MMFSSNVLYKQFPIFFNKLLYKTCRLPFTLDLMVYHNWTLSLILIVVDPSKIKFELLKTHFTYEPYHYSSSRCSNIENSGVMIAIIVKNMCSMQHYRMKYFYFKNHWKILCRFAHYRTLQKAFWKPFQHW